MKNMILAVSLVVVAGVMAGCSAGGGGVVGNNYNSTMVQPTEDTMRITTRKRVTGDIEEANTAGTTVYEALEQIKNAAAVRAAVEAKALGYDVIQVTSFKDLSQMIEKRSASKSFGTTQADEDSGTSGNMVSENDFTWGGGSHYTNTVELQIQVDLKLIPGQMPDSPPEGYMDVNQVLDQWGLAE